MISPRTAKTLCVLAAAGIMLAGCSSSPSSSPSTGAETSTSAPTSATSTAAAPQISTSDFTSDFSAMAQLTSLAASGTGLIGVLLPDTTSSTRYTQYDAPYLQKAFQAAGLSSDQFKIDNANGSASTMQTQAEADINAGASVLLVDSLDSGSGAAIQAAATAAGVKVIDYDRLTLGGAADRYYVSFDNVTVGNLEGQGLVQCISDWNVQNPNIILVGGDPKDNNAVLVRQGYLAVLQPHFDDGSYVNAAEPAGSYDDTVVQTNFEQAWTANPKINAALTFNDNMGNDVITILKNKNIPAKTFPTTGQDASLPGLQNVLTGYQCGTVYKPIYLEAQAAAATALFLRAGQTPPATLVNSTATDTSNNTQVPSIFVTPIWVTTANMQSTVVKDGAVDVSQLCAGNVASACSAAGIS